MVEAGKHPNADRLQLCRVDVGEGEPRQIVCGAWNFGARTVAVALPGAVLPGGTKLERAKLRGTVSDGMILSEREPELGADHAGIIVLPDGPEPGTLADVLPLAEDVLELEVTATVPTCSPSTGSHARSRRSSGPGEAPAATRVGAARGGDEPVDVTVEDLEAAPRYIGRLFRDAAVGPHRTGSVPAWRRPGCGRSPTWSTTNYVMHGTAARSTPSTSTSSRAGGSSFVRARERAAHARRTLRELDPSILVIADAARPVALAAIMGGEDTEVTPETTSVLLEAANFEPAGIPDPELGLRTDGSNRWEKGVDPYLAEPGRRPRHGAPRRRRRGARGATDVRDELPERPASSSGRSGPTP